MGFKFGIFPCAEGSPVGSDAAQVFDDLLAEVVQAEQSGFDSCFMTEHHQVEDGYLPAPLVLAAAVAARTERITIGTAVLLLPLFHAMHVAEDAAVVDIISKGRLLLGVGLGYQDPDFATFGVPKSNRVSLLEEGIEIIRKAWTEEKFSFSGKRYDLKGIRMTPKPIQRPSPPIWLAAAADEALARAGRLADGWIVDPTPKIPQVQHRQEVYAQAARANGRTPQVILMREGFVARSREEALMIAGEAILFTHRFYWRQGAYYHDVKKAEELTVERVAADRLILGSPEDCIAQIERWHRETGIEHFVIRFRHAVGPTIEQTLESIRLFGEKVIAHFR